MNVQCFLMVPADDWVTSHLWRRTDTGEVMRIHDAPPGAIWRAPWYEDVNLIENGGQRFLPGPDGHIYVCKTPGGEWVIDSRASNCTKPADNDHRCWCRHGEAPNFTIDKVGNTCDAGGGSILCGNYHGFLRNGVLENC